MFTIRRASRLTRWMLIGCLSLSFATVGWRAAASQGQIVVFGTSLSDPGNAFARTGATNTPPHYANDALLIPSAQYTRGGHHFSDGATWIEQYAASLGLAGSVGPAFQAGNSNARNYAVGAARACEDGKNFNLSAQVAEFLADVGGVADPEALFVLEMGGNDVRDALQAAATGGNPVAIIQCALNSIAVNIGTLHAAGAQKFLIWSVPNIALTPAIRSLGPVAGVAATQLTIAFNTGLDAVLGQLAAATGIQIRRLDAFQKLNAINANPAAFGLTDVTTACIMPNVAPYVCENPDEFLFWDGIHPTRAGHSILAQEAASVLAP